MAAGDEEDHALFLNRAFEQLNAVLVVLAFAAIPVCALIFVAVWLVIMFVL